MPGLFLLRSQRFPGVVVSGVSEKLIEERERRSLRGVFVILVLLRLVVPVLRAGNESFEAVHRVEHFTVEVVEIFVRKAHAADHVVDGFDAKLARTFEAVALVVGLAVFNLCDEHDRQILFAFGT